MGTIPDAGADYPREIFPLQEGMPADWKAVEKLYGPTSKYAGKVYCRYYSVDGKHKHICSPRQVIAIDCEAKGTDWEPVWAEYQRIVKERDAREAEIRAADRDARGLLAGEKREAAIKKFHDRFGGLVGPVVFCFAGWTTRWTYQPNCSQVRVEYIDPHGQIFLLLKDLECLFQTQLDNGKGDHLEKLIRDAQALADSEVFSQGSRKARETGGVYEAVGAEAVADGGEGRVLTQEDRAALAAKRQGNRGGREKGRHSKRARLVLGAEGLEQTGWASLGSTDDEKQAIVYFRRFLRERGFKSDVELLLLNGVAAEQKYARRLRGVYYRMGELVAGQPCYQKLLHSQKRGGKVGCDSIYLTWNGGQMKWEVTTDLRETRPVVACSAALGEVGPVSKAAGPWKVQDGNGDFFEDAGLTIVEAGVE